MKKHHTLLHCSISAFICLCSLCHAETTDEKNAFSVRDLWKLVIVDDTRNYERSISIAEEIIKDKSGTSDALTAELLLGLIEMNRALNEAEGTLVKAHAIFENLSKNHAESWQGQTARISMINILHVEGKHSETITASLKGLSEIEWELLGKNAPQDFAEYKKMTEADAEFTPDVLRMFLARSYFELGKADEAEQWMTKIENREMKEEVKEAILPH